MYLGHIWKCEKSQWRSSSHVTLFYFHMLNIWFTSKNNQSYVKLRNPDVSTQMSCDLKGQYCVEVSSSHVTLFLHIQICVSCAMFFFSTCGNCNAHVEKAYHMSMYEVQHLNFTFEFTSIYVKKSNQLTLHCFFISHVKMLISYMDIFLWNMPITAINQLPWLHVTLFCFHTWKSQFLTLHVKIVIHMWEKITNHKIIVIHMCKFNFIMLF